MPGLPCDEAASGSSVPVPPEITVRRRGRPRTADLTVQEILAWADAYQERTGDWPTSNSGPIADGDHSWSALNAALRLGLRGLPGGDSLARLLRRERQMGERRGRTPQLARQRAFGALHAQGLCAAEVGRRLGVSRQAAWEMLKRSAMSA